MRLTSHVQTSALASLALAALLVLCTIWSGCRSDQWRAQEFPEARLRFSVPESWSVHVSRPGQAPAPLGAAAPTAKEGAVVTALSALEDAAMVIYAPQREVKVEQFARHMREFIPLEEIKFEVDNKLVKETINGLPAWRGDGTGKLPADKTEVYFQSLAIDVEGQPVFVILYVEASQKERYAQVFDKIEASLQPNFEPRVEVKPPPAPARPAPMTPPPEATAAPQEDAAAPPAAPDAEPTGADAAQEAPDAPQEAPDAPPEPGEQPAPSPTPGAQEAPREAPTPPPSPDRAPPTLQAPAPTPAPTPAPPTDPEATLP